MWTIIYYISVELDGYDVQQGIQDMFTGAGTTLMLTFFIWGLFSLVSVGLFFFLGVLVYKKIRLIKPVLDKRMYYWCLIIPIEIYAFGFCLFFLIHGFPMYINNF